ncbi:MAG: SlyX family protein [Spirochaetales bacterium]|nr:SlyX family protein [Spirochaetales bacterium]
MSDTNVRIESIETKFAYLEKTVADLDALVLEYGRRTERIEEVLRALASRVDELGSGKAEGSSEEERPPHY